MGIYMSVAALPEEALAAFRKFPKMVALAEEHEGDLESMREDEEADARFFAEPGMDDLEECFDAEYGFDRHWAGIHFLLTGRNAIKDMYATTLPPLARVVIGQPFDDDGTVWGYTPADLAEIAPVLEPITRFALESRFDPAAMTAADIYPNWWNDADIASEVIDAAWSLREIFLDAAREGRAIMTHIS
jgi:hypothetical protein